PRIPAYTDPIAPVPTIAIFIGADAYSVLAKKAVTALAFRSVSRQTGLVPRQLPCQRANRHPGDGFAVSATGPGAKPWLQRRPHAIPDGTLLTGPRPRVP